MHVLQALALIALPTAITSIATPVKIVALATAITPTMQLLKKFLPSLGGWRAVVVNLFFSLVGTIAVTAPDQLHSWTFWGAWIGTALSAAGIHGTSTLLGNPDAATKNLQQRALVLLFGVACCSLLLGCVHAGTVKPLPAGAVDQTDAKANQVLQTVHAFAARETGDVQAGKVRYSPAQLGALDKLNYALNVADSAEQAYHKAGGGDAAKLNAAVAATETAFAQAQSALGIRPKP